MHYEIDQLVDDRNRPLYEQVRSEVELKIENESEPDQGWGAEYFEEQNVAIIRTTPSSTPHASFTHELLHIELELNGYKRPNYLDVIHPTDKDRYSKWANDFRIYVYNQLMHHKMFPLFVQAGFPPAHFLRVNTTRNRFFRDAIKSLKSGQKSKASHVDWETFVRIYLALQNPHDRSPEIDKFLQDLKRINSGKFNQLRRLIEEWMNDGSPNIPTYIARLFYLAGHPNVGSGHTRSSLIWGRSFVPEVK